MNDLMTETEPEVDIDDSCSLTWRRSDGTRDICRRPTWWEIQRNGEPMAFACSQDLERVLALVYCYDDDETVFLHVVPLVHLQVKGAVRGVVGTATASLRPVPIGYGLLERGHVTRDDTCPPRTRARGAPWLG